MKNKTLYEIVKNGTRPKWKELEVGVMFECEDKIYIIVEKEYNYIHCYCFTDNLICGFYETAYNFDMTISMRKVKVVEPMKLEYC